MINEPKVAAIDDERENVERMKMKMTLYDGPGPMTFDGKKPLSDEPQFTSPWRTGGFQSL